MVRGGEGYVMRVGLRNHLAGTAFLASVPPFRQQGPNLPVAEAGPGA